MAEQDKEDQDKKLQEDAAGTESKGSAKKWIIIGTVVLLLGGGGYAAWDYLLAERLLGKDNPKTAETNVRTALLQDIQAEGKSGRQKSYPSDSWYECYD